MKRPLMTAAMLLTTSAAQAHEVWIERDGTGPARIYLGEPAEIAPPGGDPEFSHLKAPKLVPGTDATLVRKAGYLEVAVPAGDVRAHDDSVFAPWGAEGKQEGVVYYARAGRAEPRAVLPFEITPAAADSNRFTLMRDGKPVADAAVTIISPDKWTKSVKTDANGGLTVAPREKGRYLLTAAAKDEGDLSVAGSKVAVLHSITTTSFHVK